MTRFDGCRVSMSRLAFALLGVALACLCFAVWGVASASAAVPWWHLTSASAPSTLPPGGEARISVLAANIGDAASDPPITLSDVLPAGLTAQKVSFYATSFELGAIVDLGPEGPLSSLDLCKVEPREVTCTYPDEPAAEFLAPPPFEGLEMVITVEVAAGARAGEVNEAAIAGGGAGGQTVRQPLSIGGTETKFGFQDNDSIAPEEEGGAIDARAGSHPFQLTTSLNLNQASDPEKPPALVKDLDFNLPPGLVANVNAIPQCTYAQFQTEYTELGTARNECPADTAVGVAVVGLKGITGGGSVAGYYVPVFNLTPQPGEPARFAFLANRIPVQLGTSVRTGGDYGVTVSVHDIPTGIVFISSLVTFWGVPGDARHNQSRGWSCLHRLATCEPSGAEHPAAFLTLPTTCEAPFAMTVEGDSWAAPGKPSETAEPASYTLPDALDSCNQLSFDPTISVAPDVQEASTPTGLTVKVHVPQEEALEAEGTAEAAVRNTTVTLPAGVTLDPSGAGGLEACSEADIGFLGKQSGEPALNLFTSTLPEPFCPDGAKVGTVTIHTPLLPNPLEGAVYLASPAPNGEAGQNPFNSLVAMYIVAEDPVSGTLVKLPGKVIPDPVTGQLTATFEDTPELPFEELELHFFGGSRAPLATPGLCGSYTTRASFTPWSGNEPVQSSSTFDITSGPHHSACPSGSQPFQPEFQAGTTNNQAGAFTSLTTTMGHPDGDQTLGGLSITLPPGLSGTLSNVKLCGEPQAEEGKCGPESLIGHTVVTAGLGDTPAVVKRPGSVYITGPYEGAPFGLSIVNPAEAGPFDLGEVVVRAKVEVDPHTAQLTIVSGALPTILDGIPLLLQHVNVTVERPDFTFNPTNCSKLQVEGSMSSSEGASAPVSSPFQATNCATLKFEPKFAVSTAGKTSKADGASLTVKLTYPNTPQGTEANIAKVKVDLPKQLPSRLTTLQKACLAATFEANPASCPAASVVGHAKAITPILPVPLEGPAYFVSHGGEAFPSLIVVLQGYGVTVDLVGSTFISKAGITSSTFKTVPDVPVGTFELTLPTGPYSALAADVPAKDNYSLCGQTLKMPTAFVAQNGAEIHQTTPVTITGCAKTKTKTLTRAQKLKRALKACKKDKKKGKRAACERKARKRYGPVKKKKVKKK